MRLQPLVLFATVAQSSAVGAGLDGAPRLFGRGESAATTELNLGGGVPAVEFDDGWKAGETQCASTKVPLPFNHADPCNATITICSSDLGKTWMCNATAYELADGVTDKSVGFGSTFTNQTLAFYDAISRLLLTMDATSNHTDCSCVSMDYPEGASCKLRVAYCAYALPIDPNSPPDTLTVLYRARAWDLNNEEYSGESAGYQTLSEGTTLPQDAEIQAANNLRTNFPKRPCGTVSPLILVPGFTSSEVQYRMHNSPPPKGHPLCPTSTPNDAWETLYPAPVNQSLLQIPCWISTLASAFDPATSTFGPVRQGLETRTLDFGGFGGIPGFQAGTATFQIAGWELGKTLFAVPFDWRMPSPGLESMFAEMQQLVENVTAMNNGAKASIWAFSGGPQIALSFLHRQTQSWKDAHIDWFVATSPVWGGVTEAVSAYVSGATAPVLNPNASTKLEFQYFRNLARSLPAALWYFPRAGGNASTSWTRDEPIIKTKTKQYSAFDAVEILTDVGADPSIIAARKFLENESDLGTFAAPGVNTFVTYGTGTPVIVSLGYPDDFSPGHASQPLPSSCSTESGDGLVPLRSSLRGTEWAESQAIFEKQLVYREYPNQPHAQCFPGAATAGTQCFEDVLSILRS